MAPQKSPAFQFYPKDFMAGTATMSLQEVGAYMRLLCYAWDAGSVPTDANERARILGCAKSQETALWLKVSKKFVLQDDVYLNERMEDERKKQSEYRRRQSDRGKASAATRNTNQRSNAGSTSVATPVEPRPVDVRYQPEGNSSSSSSSSSSRTQEVNGSPTTKHRGVGLIVGGGEYVRLMETHAYVGAKLRIPKVLHAELIAKSGANADSELRAWYARLDEDLENSGKGTGDIFAWIRPRHQAFAVEKGWVETAKNGTERTDRGPAFLARLEAIERGERKR